MLQLLALSCSRQQYSWHKKQGTDSAKGHLHRLVAPHNRQNRLQHRHDQIFGLSRTPCSGWKAVAQQQNRCQRVLASQHLQDLRPPTLPGHLQVLSFVVIYNRQATRENGLSVLLLAGSMVKL
jgi:hypothetical protein